MTFQRIELLPIILICAFIFFFFSLKGEKSFFKWVKTYWSYKRTKINKIASVFYYLGFLFIGLALLDPRGPEKRVTGKVGDQKTIILIDTSASMLAEDVRPNRFEKATLLAKHFIKKAVGHQLSVVVFSDGQKRLIPFTSDKDLVEARLNALDDLDLDRGGTGLSLAIQESIQYFINSENKPFGNMIIFTDAEETDGGIKLEVPDGISVAVVGIGTSKGAPIPERNRRGVFRGNKKHNGKTVISKLDENYLKSLGEKVEHFKYWVASSYTIPTEEILKFFQRSFKTKLAKNDFRIRPVLANWFLVPGAIMLLLSFLLKNGRSLTPAMALAMMLLSPDGKAQDQGPPEPPPKSEMVQDLEEKLSKNELDNKGKEKLALELLKGERPEQAKKLYQEILPRELNEKTKSSYLNYGASQFESGSINEGMATYDKLMNYLKKNPSSKNEEMLSKSKKNVLKAIQTENQKQKQKKDQKSKEGNEGKKGQQGQGGGKSDQEGQEGESSGEQQDGKDDGKQDEKKKGEKEDQKGDKKENEDSQGDSGEKGRDKKKGRPKEGPEDQKVKSEMPAILKQLMSDDNNLQKKVIDADTVKRKTREKKDW